MMRYVWAFTLFQLAVLMIAVQDFLPVFSLNTHQKQPNTGAPQRRPSGSYTFRHKGLDRSYTLHLPKNHGRGKKLPLVLALHGFPGSGENMAQFSGLREKADEVGFIAVFPDATPSPENQWRNWNSGACCGHAYGQKIDDAGFLHALVSSLIVEYQVDDKRIYAVGFSKGGMMAYYFACVHAELLAGIMVVGGTFNLPVCSPSRNLDVLIVHGLDDSLVPVGDLTTTTLIASDNGMQPLGYALHTWRRINHCQELSRKTSRGVITIEFGCFRAKLQLFLLEKTGHVWPGARPGLYGMGHYAGHFDANGAMVDFFQLNE